MIRWLCLFVLVPAVLALGACAHPLALNPNLTGLAGSGSGKIDKKVGLVITEQDRRLEVTTPGGGGDKVTYFPYRDLETGLYMALAESFSGVSRVAGAEDPKVRSEGLSYLITPRLVTNSSSESALTWPPTLFTIELSCKVVDAGGQPVAALTVSGEGRATFDEFKREVSLSANRAAEDALKKLIKALGQTAALR
jgi:hypothetical protein